MKKPWLIRMPDHLGDGVMAIPVVNAMARKHKVVLIGPHWLPEMFPEMVCIRSGEIPPENQGMLLLKPSFGAAWRNRKQNNKVGEWGVFRSLLLNKSVRTKGPHRIQRYKELAELIDIQSLELPSYKAPPGPCPTLPKNCILLIVGTASPETVRWNRFRELAEKLTQDRVVFAGGPGDEEAVRTLGQGYHKLPTDLSIQEFARASLKAKKIIGLDSGLTHLATASRRGAGMDPTDVVVIYGSTDPDQTGPTGSTAALDDKPSCWPCYAKKCKIGAPCLETEPTYVMREMG